MPRNMSDAVTFTLHAAGSTAVLGPDLRSDRPPSQARREATLRAKALSGVGRNLLDGMPMQDTPLAAPFKLAAEIGQRQSTITVRRDLP
jgi:hypothetical protein